MSDTYARARQSAFVPKPILELADVVELFDELAARAHRMKRRIGPAPTTDRRTVKRQLDACEIEYLPGRKKGGKFYFTYRALAEAIGGNLLASIEDVDALVGSDDE